MQVMAAALLLLILLLVCFNVAILDHTTSPFTSLYSSLPTLVFATIKVHVINFNATVT
jgi:hypothetical protein